MRTKRVTCGEPEALLYARGPHWRRRCVHARRYYARFPLVLSSPPHGSRVWVHYGITAHPHSSTVQNRPGTPFRYAAVHEPHTESWGSVDKVLVQPRALVLVYTPVLVYTSIVLAVEVLYGDGSIVLRPGTQYIVLHPLYRVTYINYILALSRGVTNFSADSTS